MKVLEIPLSPQNQRVATTLAGVVYVLTVQWRNAAGAWFLDIADADNVPLLQGLALVSGDDLLGQHPELGMGGTLVVLCAPDVAAPTFDNLGTGARLLFVVP